MDKTTASAAGIERLGLDATVILAGSTMSPADVARARRAGRLDMEGPENGLAMLEVGGTVMAEGRVEEREGRRVLVLTRMFADGKEATT